MPDATSQPVAAADLQQGASSDSHGHSHSHSHSLSHSLRLTREVTCIRSLAWRCDLPPSLHWAGLVNALETSGLSAAPAVRGLSRLVSDSGDEIVLVPRSGRVQLRVHYTIPEHERRFAAERLFQLLVTAIRRL